MDTDGFVFKERPTYIVHLFVHVAVNRVSDDVLVPIGKSLVAHGPRI